MRKRKKTSVRIWDKLLKSKNFKLYILAAIILVLFMAAKRASIYVIFIVVTGIIIYYSKLYHLPIDVSPLFFLEIVITKYYSFKLTLLFVLLAYIIPKTFAGSNMKFDSYVFISISMLANLFVLLFPTMNLLTVGLITSVIQYIGGIIFSMTMKPFFLAAADGLANVANNILWFLIFSDFIIWLL